ncbi:MAG: hypothetical protein HKN82_19705 [Akkermansiaceae bacterium]|nr:hypothetical protein [Akkermansiaceae bacterium]
MKSLVSLAITMSALAAGTAWASVIPASAIQVGDFRLSSGTYSGGITYFDPSSPTHQTRGVTGAPVQLVSDFVAATQNPGGTPDSGSDIGLQTYSSATNIRTLNRFTADQDGPGPEGGPQRAGAVQWSLDLTPLDSYLGTNNLALTTLALQLNTDPSDDTKLYDVYLSYTNAAESIALAGISTGAASGDDNYDDFWFPAQSVAEGGVANGTHKVVELDYAGNMNLTLDLLALYNSGVTDLNLIMASGDFFSSRTVSILEDSGIWLETTSATAVPEASEAVIFALGVMGLAVQRRRRR